MDENYIEDLYYQINNIVYSIKKQIRNDTFKTTYLKKSIPKIKKIAKNMIKYADLGTSDYFVQQAKLDLFDLSKELDSIYEIDLSRYLDINKLFKPKSEPGFKWVEKGNKIVKVKINSNKKPKKKSPKKKPKKKSTKKKSPRKQFKKCPRNKIVNPKTGRCVLKTGKIGKALLNK